MKKNFFKSVFALMCACVMTTSFVACGSDDDDNNSGKKQEQQQEDVEPGKLLSASSAFVVTSTGLDALKAMSADGKVMIRYTYGNGTVKTEEITSSKFEKAVDYAFDNNGDIVVSMQIYLSDINEEKVREIIGTQYMEVELKGSVVLKYENTNDNRTIKNIFNFKVFERTEDLVNTAVRTLQRDKERYGVIPLTTYGLKASNERIMSSTSWLGN